ncbi:hypothetical protein AMJ85_10035 [candidate division BRC1 bacterium SM23_51]|nr:MAG: hypothetical protein AMJ85_10035 [candidate division BRC1 bacterium SM23_51]
MAYGRVGPTTGRWTGRLSLIVAAMTFVANQAWAQSPIDVRLLTPREQRRLNRPARQAYDKAVTALDHIDAVGAIALFDQASELAPDTVELHFLTARLAHLRARMIFGNEAAEYYDTAEKALERIARQKSLSPLVRQRYDTQLKTISDEKKKLEVRDAKRKAIGDAFCKLYAKETYTSEEEAEKKKEEEKKSRKKMRAAQRARAAAGGPLLPPRPGGAVRSRGADSES